MTTPDALLGLLTRRPGGVLATLKSDGRPQLSNVSHTFDPTTGVIRVSITAGRAKYHNLLRDPRASYHVTSEDFWAFTVVDSVAELTPVAADPHDATVDELVEVYRAIAGEHSDWEDYRRAMVADRRVVLRLPVGHVYGQAPR